MQVELSATEEEEEKKIHWNHGILQIVEPKQANWSTKNAIWWMKYSQGKQKPFDV